MPKLAPVSPGLSRTQAPNIDAISVAMPVYQEGQLILR